MAGSKFKTMEILIATIGTLFAECEHALVRHFHFYNQNKFLVNFIRHT